MRRLLRWSLMVPVAVAGLLTAGCVSQPAPSRPAAPVPAVYMAGSPGHLAQTDLDAHPVRAVVHTQRELASAVTTGLAIWIDRSAAPSVDRMWLHARKREGCTIALIGTGNAIEAFWFELGLGGHLGTGISNEERAKRGFSVWRTKGIGTGTPTSYVRGFATTPTVDSVSAVTNELLKGVEP